MAVSPVTDARAATVAARAVFEAAIAAVRPERLLARFDLDGLLPIGPIRLLAAGKAALGLAGAAEAQLGARVVEGLVVLPHGYAATAPTDLPRPRQMEVVEASHPAPDEASVGAGRRALALARRAREDGGTLLVLLSGGSSALLELPSPGLSLNDLHQTNRLLLRAGVPVAGMNAVRKHLSTLKGGRLAAVAHPAYVFCLVLSDVVGDDLAVIASGPTVADPTTFGDALRVLDEAGVRGIVPSAVRRHIEAGTAGEREETPKAGDPRLTSADTRLIGTNADALEGAYHEAERRGYRVEVRANDVVGEAREVGLRLGNELRSCLEGKACLLWAGEPVVTVTGNGLGGRCQEAALAAALALGESKRALAFLAAGTDGVDGPTGVAGAVVTERTAATVRACGLDPGAALVQNDSHAFFAAASPNLPAGEGLVVTGPTHTNVMDVFVGLID